MKILLNKNKKVMIILILIIFLAIITYFEFFRSFKIGVAEFNNNLYEKDFVQNGFSYSMVSTEDYYYTNEVKFNVGEGNIPGIVKANFSQMYGWYESFYFYIEITFIGNENIKDILSYLKENFGKINKTEEIMKGKKGEVKKDIKYFWRINDGYIFVNNYDTEFSKMTEITLGKKIEPSVPFRWYILIKKYLINIFPNSWEPKWVKQVEPKL